MGVVFTYNGENTHEFKHEYGKVIREEFYDGDIDLDPSTRLNVTMEKALARPMSLMRIRTNTGISYRRSWSHIRAKNVGVRVIWFVQRGSLKLVRSRHSCTVNAGEAGILDSGLPFFAHAIPDENGLFEATQAVVPAHLFLSHLPAAVEFDRPFMLFSTGQHVVTKLLDILFGEGDNLSLNAADPLVIAFLEALADDFSQQGVLGGRRRQSVVDKRLADIETYIMKNLTDPELCYDEVAAKCGISPRYLCYVLKAKNTSFSSMLWSQRLPKAREWLASPALQSHAIHEIALMAGFKSAAHFSRMFKTHYGCSPKEFRGRALMEAGLARACQDAEAAAGATQLEAA
jgi:AraC family transcriptional regulator, positive regulator of tynA and feaB